MRPNAFPRRFTWGVATAAAQIEGYHDADGKGESTWERFARSSPTVWNNDTPAGACEHYRRYRGDVRLMRRLGMRNYRFSVAWPRIQPTGTGPANAKGLDFYDRLVDTLLAEGITPWTTLFHWDTPVAIEDRGGWCERATVDAFTDYAALVIDRLGDRVKRWFTINETKCFTTFALHAGANKAPGVQRSPQQVNQAVHHANLAHGRAVQLLRAHGRAHRVGCAENLDNFVPLTETPADIAAARALFVRHNAPILGAIHTGRYDPAWLRSQGADRPRAAPGDLAVISSPIDFTGLNVYTGTLVRAGRRGPEVVPFSAEHAGFCAGRWLRYLPRAMYWGLRFTHEVYGARSLLVTENGVGHQDEEPAAGGEVLDTWRVEHCRAYLAELLRARADGVPVDGYFAWSFMDNYEWAEGYRTRFGLVRTDYATQRRTPKLSARWYGRVVAANALV